MFIRLNKRQIINLDEVVLISLSECKNNSKQTLYYISCKMTTGEDCRSVEFVDESEVEEIINCLILVKNTNIRDIGNSLQELQDRLKNCIKDKKGN